ncbi:T9SS type A sorting domain-containing protein [Bacteroidota bacterium]|nr:T9SS type A sorting domain-containing protein [Bacteroidota bacterium]
MFVLSNTFFHSQYLVSCIYLGISSSNILSGATGLNLDYDVKMYKLTYNTVDTDSLSIIATGAFFIPTNTSCTEFPFAVYNHGTTLRKNDVPSNNNPEAIIGKVFSAGGYFVCMPDYIGMGDSPGFHPYVHAKSEATASIDMIRAAREYLTTTNFVDNNELFLTGYSQGGHACMATTKFIKDESLQSEFNIVASAPSSGPYDLSGIMADTIIAPTPYSNPGYIVYLLASYQLAYGNIFNSWSDVLYSPYDTIVPPFFSGNNTTLDMGLLNSLIPNQMNLLIRDTCLNNFINDSINKNHPWWRALIDNDNYDWLPLNPLRMYYCTADEQIAYTNALIAESTMNNNGALDVQAVNMGDNDHGGCILPALSSAFNWFQTLRTPCNISSLTSRNLISYDIYPNPFTNKLNIQFNEKVKLSVYTMDGKLLINKFNVQNIELITTNWPKGMYIVKVKGSVAYQNAIITKQ